LFLALLVTALRGVKKVSRASFQCAEGDELRLMSGATLVSLLSFAFGGCVAHLAYDYYFFYLIAIACALQRIARRSSISGANSPLARRAGWEMSADGARL
jgi:hypothetical protein